MGASKLNCFHQQLYIGIFKFCTILGIMKMLLKIDRTAVEQSQNVVDIQNQSFNQCYKSAWTWSNICLPSLIDSHSLLPLEKLWWQNVKVKVTFQAPLNLRRLSVKPTGITGFTCPTVWHLLARDTQAGDSYPTAVPVAVKVNCSITVLQGHQIISTQGMPTEAQHHLRFSHGFTESCPSCKWSWHFDSQNWGTQAFVATAML